MGRDLYAHPEEDFIPLETHEADDAGDAGDVAPDLAPIDAPGPAFLDPPADVAAYIREAARIYASAAAGAFMEKRLALQTRHGPAARTDLGVGLYAIVQDGRDTLLAVLDRIRGAEPSAEQLELARRSLDTSGALLLAARDVLERDLAAAIGRERTAGEGR